MRAAIATLTGKKRRRVVGILSAALMSAAAGCGLPDDAPEAVPLSDVGPMVPAPDPLQGSPITDTAALTGAMLVSNELPDGYVLIPDPVRDLGLDPAPEYDAPDKSGTDPQSCAEVLAAIAKQSAGAAADAEVRFSGPNFSSIDEDAASYTENGAADAFAAVQETFADCATYSGTDADGIVVDYRLGGREQNIIGDASTSVRLETKSEGFTLVSEAVVAIVDRTVFQLAVTSQHGVTQEVLTSLAVKAADKIRGANAKA